MPRSMDVDSMSEEDLQAALLESQEKLSRALRQINYLDVQISYLRKLFRRAEKNNGYAVRYNLRMQLSIVSGVKVMYHHYAAVEEDRMSRLRSRINEPSNPSSPRQAMDNRTET